MDLPVPDQQTGELKPYWYQWKLHTRCFEEYHPREDLIEYARSFDPQEIQKDFLNSFFNGKKL